MGEVDYLQIYDNPETGKVIYCIDDLSDGMKRSSRYSEEEVVENKHKTIFLQEEYLDSRLANMIKSQKNAAKTSFDEY